MEVEGWSLCSQTQGYSRNLSFHMSCWDYLSTYHWQSICTGTLKCTLQENYQLFCFLVVTWTDSWVHIRHQHYKSAHPHAQTNEQFTDKYHMHMMTEVQDATEAWTWLGLSFTPRFKTLTEVSGMPMQWAGDQKLNGPEGSIMKRKKLRRKVHSPHPLSLISFHFVKLFFKVLKLLINLLFYSLSSVNCFNEFIIEI